MFSLAPGVFSLGQQARRFDVRFPHQTVLVQLEDGSHVPLRVKLEDGTHTELLARMPA